MKYFKYIIASCLMTGMLASCDSLDYSPEDWYGSSNFWQNDAQVAGFMVGMHKHLRDVNQNIFLMGEARGGTQKTGSGSQGVSLNYSAPIKDNTFTRNNTGIINWGDFYSKILNVNEFIGKVERECDFLDSAAKKYYLGQAYGIRAYYYFHLYRTFGGVPLVKEAKVMGGITDAESLYEGRATAKQTLDFIKEDITRSETAFGDNNTIKLKKGMWSKAATMMLKGEVYLWSAKVTTGDQAPAIGDLGISKAAILSLIDKDFRLLPFKNVFAYENKGNDEVIFAIRFALGEAGNWAYDFTYRNANFVNTFYDAKGLKIATDILLIQDAGIQRHEWKEGFFETYDKDDTRRNATFLDYYDKDGILSGTVFTKCLGTINGSTGKRAFSDDYIIYRYADALLMMAEIANMEGGDVATYINKVRERAYAENYNKTLHGYTNSTFEENELTILYERDKEFVWEGKRWYDICRMWDANHKPLAFSAKANYDSANPVLKESEAYKLLWPIDINTLNNDSKLENNLGYDK